MGGITGAMDIGKLAWDEELAEHLERTTVVPNRGRVFSD